MRENWRPATVNALAELLGWYARREAGRLAAAPAANDSTATTPAANDTAPGAPEGVASRRRCT